VLPLHDLIRDAYDRVIHYADHRSEDKPTPVSTLNNPEPPQ